MHEVCMFYVNVERCFLPSEMLQHLAGGLTEFDKLTLQISHTITAAPFQSLVSFFYVDLQK